MMKYTGKYYRTLTLFMKKYLKEQYGKDITKKALQKAPAIYKDIRNRLPDTVITEDSNSGFLFIKSVNEKRGSLAEVREENRRYIQNC